MAKEIAGLSQALRNANDAQGLIDTGESALKEVSPSSKNERDRGVGIK